MRLMLAIRAFFAVLSDRELAGGVKRLLGGEAAEQAKAEVPRPSGAGAVAEPQRSEAITLLAALQRESRFLDLVREPLGDYSDAQIGAAARDVLRDCNAVLERMFELRPVSAEDEGAEVTIDEGFDPGRYRFTGNVGGQPPLHGRLVHHGWEATRCELPTWSGASSSARVVAAAEVELT